MDFYRLCCDHRIEVAPEGHHHYRPGWVNVECPFCTGNPGYHLGYSIEDDYFRCWRCGWHTQEEVIAVVLRCSRHSASEVLTTYKGRPRARRGAGHTGKVLASVVKMPMGTGPLGEIHQRYLRGRKFDPDRLASIWGLKGTGPIGPYKFRIIAPIFVDGVLVSYQGRDVTGKSELRYKACPGDQEVRNHKEVVYGIDVVRGDSVVVVEGITDAWRLGPGAVATFGISFKLPQALLLRRFTRRFILFDNEPEAQKQARKLAAILSAFPGEVELLRLFGLKDPGEMNQEDADELMERLGFDTTTYNH